MMKHIHLLVLHYVIDDLMIFPFVAVGWGPYDIQKWSKLSKNITIHCKLVEINMWTEIVLID